MKRCPQCSRDYSDDTLSFYLDDGAALLDGPASGSQHVNGDRSGFMVHSPVPFLDQLKNRKERRNGVMQIRVEYMFEPLRDDPGYKRILERIGLPQ